MTRNASSMRILSSTKFRSQFQEVIDEVHYTGKPVVISRHGKPWVMLTHLSEDDETLQTFIQEHTDPDTGKLKK